MMETTSISKPFMIAIRSSSSPIGLCSLLIDLSIPSRIGCMRSCTIEGGKNGMVSKAYWRNWMKLVGSGSRAGKHILHEAHSCDYFSYLRCWVVGIIQGKLDGCWKVGTPSPHTLNFLNVIDYILDLFDATGNQNCAAFLVPAQRSIQRDFRRMGKGSYI
jgi:hypothetical protein